MMKYVIVNTDDKNLYNEILKISDEIKIPILKSEKIENKPILQIVGTDKKTSISKELKNSVYVTLGKSKNAISLPSEKEKLIKKIDKELCAGKNIYLFFGVQGGLGVSTLTKALGAKIPDSVVLENSEKLKIDNENNITDFALNEKVKKITSNNYKNIIIDGICTNSEMGRLSRLSKKTFIFTKNTFNAISLHKNIKVDHDLIVRNIKHNKVLENEEMTNIFCKKIFNIPDIDVELLENNGINISDDQKYSKAMKPILDAIMGKGDEISYDDEFYRKELTIFQKIKELFVVAPNY